MTESSPQPILQVCLLSHRFGSRLVLDSVDLSVGLGVTSVLGPNGAGKTTLLRLIHGDLRVQDGRVEVRGRKEGNAALSPSSAGFLPQNPYLVERLTCLDFVAYCAWLGGISSRHASESAERALAQVGLGERSTDRIRKLSGGMKRRLALAAVLAPDPEFLLLDEPTVGLDPEQRADLRRLLVTLGKRIPILVATHSLDDAHRISEQIVLLDHGQVRFAGTVAEFAGGDAAEVTAESMEAAYLRRLGIRASP